MADPNSPPPAQLEGDEPETDELGDIETDYDDPPLDLPIGEPFALVHDAELLERDDAQGIPGTFASVQCECGEAFRANLLTGKVKVCPSCKAGYTHALLWARTDNTAIVDEFVDDVIAAAGDAEDAEGDDEQEPEQPRRRTIRDAGE